MNGIDVAPVSRWLQQHVVGAVGPFEFEVIAGGRSNLTFRVTGADGTRFVLRRPPLGHVLATAHDMAREHRLISAVGRTGVPVPPALGLCTDEEVNGAPFYVMAFVDGVVLDSPGRAAELAPQLRRDGYVERQVKRWSQQWEMSKTRELPAVDEVARLLREHMPPQQGVSIAHGDYRFGNVLTDVHAGRVAAVLDWELCTLGDPLADVGYLGVYWHREGSTDVLHNDPTVAGGFPDYRELVERYAQRTGRDLSAIDYYVAFGAWRLAVISEGVYARYLHGAMGSHEGVDIDSFRIGAELLSERALTTLRAL